MAAPQVKKARGGDTTLKKKQVLAVVGVVCVVALFLSVLVYAPSPWTTQDMVDYMYNVGRGKIWKTCKYVVKEITPKVADIWYMVDYEVDHEIADVEVQTIDYDTVIDLPHIDFALSDTQIGGTDHESDVYVLASWRGLRCPFSLMDVEWTVVDGSKYIWAWYLRELRTGVYAIKVEALSSVAMGSYLVEVNLSYEAGPYTYSGRASYVIDCTATTT